MILKESRNSNLLTIAHRGNSSAAPENTLAAFDSAAGAGARMIETDLQLTRDGVTVLFHDDVLGRTVTGPVRRLDETSWAELEGADAGSWFDAGFSASRVPCLRDLIHWSDSHPDVGWLLEFKGKWSAAALEPVTAALWDAGIAERCVLQGFSRETVRNLHHSAPGIPRALLLAAGPGTPAGRRDLTEFLNSVQAAACNPSGSALRADPSLVDLLHGNGQRVFVWTLNEREQWEQAEAAGVDGIITDRPGTLQGWQSGMI